MHTRQTPAAATGDTTLAAPVAFDKLAYARRWGMSRRTVDNWLAAGLPHLKFGARRVRILPGEADEWLRQRFSTQRRGPVEAKGIDTQKKEAGR